jgi:hypothetical protein
VLASSYVASAVEEPAESDRRPARRDDLPADGPRRPAPFGLFDTDRDGVVSVAEINAASEVLRRFDKNKDGQLSGDELTPPRRPRPGARGEPSGPGEGPGEGEGRPPRGEGHPPRD